MGDVTLAHNGAMSIPLQPVTSLRRPAQPNAPSASCWLRRVPDDGGRRVWTSPSCKGCRGRSHCPVILSSKANRQGCMPWELDFNAHIHPIPTEKPVGIPQNPHIHITQKSSVSITHTLRLFVICIFLLFVMYILYRPILYEYR